MTVVGYNGITRLLAISICMSGELLLHQDCQLLPTLPFWDSCFLGILSDALSCYASCLIAQTLAFGLTERISKASNPSICHGLAMLWRRRRRPTEPLYLAGILVVLGSAESYTTTPKAPFYLCNRESGVDRYAILYADSSSIHWDPPPLLPLSLTPSFTTARQHYSKRMGQFGWPH